MSSTLNPSPFLALPLSIRNKIYAQVIQSGPKSSTTSFPLAFVSRQIQSEFTTKYELYMNARFRCCLGRTLQDREATKFYAWNYQTAPGSTTIDVTPKLVANLKTCIVRCTLEQLSDWERRSDTGTESFKDCLRILVRTFEDCRCMRDLCISFDHFILSGKKGSVSEPDEVWDRLKSLDEIPGLKEITFETPGFSEDFVWRKEKSGKKGRGREAWTRVVEDRGSAHVQIGARAPKGYGLRRGNT